ncbi:MAG: TetR family transcriptional regulator [Acidobacteriota bacterium]|nr:TetR family transcriptional regulator [Acidobacteriota bacterium]
MAVNREVIVAAALGILDEFGLADLSMRRIGDAVGVQAATIYWHFANKQTLLAEVSDAILSAQAEPPKGEFGGSLAGWARDLRSVLLGHRDAAELVAATLAVGLGERGPDGSAARVFESAGWLPPDAQRAARATTHFVLGHVMQEQTRQNLLRVGVLAASVEALDDAGFELGLQLLVKGAETLRNLHNY